MPTAVDASSTKVNNIGITCQIDQNGTATFVEKWDMDVSEGTEGYKIFNGMNDQPLTLIGVTDDRGVTYKISVHGILMFLENLRLINVV